MPGVDLAQDVLDVAGDRRCPSAQIDDLDPVSTIEKVSSARVTGLAKLG
jgi:hypothetical protein